MPAYNPFSTEEALIDHALLCIALELPVFAIPLTAKAMLKLMVKRALGTAHEVP